MIDTNLTKNFSCGYNYYPTFSVNPVEKWIEALEEIKPLNLELLKAKDEHIKVLEKLVKISKPIARICNPCPQSKS